MRFTLIPFQRITPRFLTFLITGLVASTSGLTACSSLAEGQSPDLTLQPMMEGSPGMGGMNHGGMMMNHGMDLGPADANYDLRFIDAMIPHHEGAVVMAKEALQKATRPELKQLATNIIKAQTQEIAEMKQWRKQWYPQASETPVAWHAAMGHMMPMTTDQKHSMMMSMDLGPADANFDLRFINAMIPHHEGAVVMAKDLSTKSQRPEMEKLAQAILDSQQAEISQMQQWRKAWYQQ